MLAQLVIHHHGVWCGLSILEDNSKMFVPNHKKTYFLGDKEGPGSPLRPRSPKRSHGGSAEAKQVGCVIPIH